MDFGTCCSRKFCLKSKTVFVRKAHLSTVKASKSYLTVLLYLEHTADELLRVQKLVGDNHPTSDVTISWTVHVTHGYNSLPKQLCTILGDGVC